MDRQRIDKWLWHARVVRTRSAAAGLVGSGHVRINSKRIEAAGYAVKAGDVITVALDRTVRVLRVVAFVERRGGSETARALYEDLAPPPSARSSARPEPAPAGRDPGAGRPTKRERRAIERFTGEDEELP